MNEEQLKQLVEAIKKDLSNGRPKQDIVAELVQEGIPQDQADQLVSQIEAEVKGGGGGQGAQGGGQSEQGGGQKISAEDAYQWIKQNQIEPAVALALLELFKNIASNELAALQQRLAQEQGGGQGAPAEQEPEGEPRV